MDPIQPWIDADEMRQLAEKLMQPKTRVAETPQDAGFGDGFEGFAEAPAPSTKPALISDHTQPLAEMAPAQPTILEAKPAPEPQYQPKQPEESFAQSTPATPIAEPTPPQEPLAVNDPTLHQSLLELQRQLESNHQADGLFILNRAGEILFGKNNHIRLQFIARNLIQLASRKGVPSGNVHIKVGPSRILEIISTEAADDGLILGMVVPTPLDSPTRKRIAQQMSAMHISRARS